MSVMEAVPDMVVPDSIEAVEEWRTWKFDGTNLVSITNDTVWKAGEPLKAACQGAHGQWEWALTPNGISCEQAAENVKQQREQYQARSTYTYSGSGIAYYQTGFWFPDAPRVEPPPGYGYAMQPIKHEAPNTNCSCGIYAGRTPGDCPTGDVLGKVKLWGTVVPGTKGSRAEFAYPSELHVPAKLANDPALLAYGVPIVVVDAKEIKASTDHTKRSGMHWTLKLSVCLNIGAAALNFTLLGLRSL